MAKSKLDKFKDVVAEAAAFLSAVVVGDEAGQYAQEDVDAFNAVFESAKQLSEDESLEPSRYDEEFGTLATALSDLQLKVIVNATPSAVIVTLRGTPSQLKGSHTIHFKQHIVTFIDGKADLSKELAEELTTAGYVE